MKRKKLYYAPGIISIIGMPVLLFFWGPEDPVQFNVVKMNLPSLKKDLPEGAKFTTDYVYQYLKTKKLEIIYLEEYAWDEQSFSFKNNFNFAINEIGRLQCARDTSVALKIQLSSQSSYGEFMRLQDEALIYDYGKYALVDNEFYFFPNRPPYDSMYTEIQPLSIDVSLFPERKPPTKWESFQMEMKYEWRDLHNWVEYLFYHQKQNRQLAAGFLLLIMVPAIIKIRKYSRNKNVYYFSA